MPGFAEGVPTVKVTLGGKPYELAWTWGSKRRLGDKAQITDAKALSDNLGALVWATMDKESREALSVEDVEELLHPGNQVEVIDKIGSLFALSEPSEEPGKNGGPVAVKEPTTGNLTSRTSGQSESTISA